MFPLNEREGELDKDWGGICYPLSVNVFRVFCKTLPFVSSISSLINGTTLCYPSIASVSLNFLFYQPPENLLLIWKRKNIWIDRYEGETGGRNYKRKTRRHVLSLVRERSGDYFRSVRSSSALLLPLCPEIMDTITLTRPQSLSR